MRGPLDDVARLYYGPSTFSPGAFRVAIPCRKVRSLSITLALSGFGNRVGWFTCDSLDPRGPLLVTGGSTPQWNFGWADTVRFDSAPTVTYAVLAVEYITYDGRPTYYRGWYGPRPT